MIATGYVGEVSGDTVTRAIWGAVSTVPFVYILWVLEEMVENGEHFDEAIECDDTEEIKDSARERISGIHHILQALPQTHQDVIKLFSQGLEWKAIGKTLNIPTRTVVSRMYYARKTIKKHLSPPKEQESIEEIGRKFNNT